MAREDYDEAVKTAKNRWASLTAVLSVTSGKTVYMFDWEGYLELHFLGRAADVN